MTYVQLHCDDVYFGTNAAFISNLVVFENLVDGRVGYKDSKLDIPSSIPGTYECVDRRFDFLPLDSTALMYLSRESTYCKERMHKLWIVFLALINTSLEINRDVVKFLIEILLSLLLSSGEVDKHKIPVRGYRIDNSIFHK
jgi:hypothetical protein